MVSMEVGLPAQNGILTIYDFSHLGLPLLINPIFQFNQNNQKPLKKKKKSKACLF